MLSAAISAGTCMSVCRRYRCTVHDSFSPSKDWSKDFAMQDVYCKLQETDETHANWRFQHKRIEHFDRFIDRATR